MGVSDLVSRLLRLFRIPESWDSAWLTGGAAAALVLLITLLLSSVVARFIARVVRRLTARTTTKLDDEIVDLAEKPFRRLIVVIGVYLAVLELPLGPKLRQLATGVVLAVGVIVAVGVAVRISHTILMAYGRNITDDDGRAQFEKDYIPLINKVISVVLVIIGLIAVLDHFGSDVSSLVAALGIGGVAISFAAKETLGHMIAGFALLVDRPFRPGDTIRLASGEQGDVIEVGTRSTRVRLTDGNMLIVPNSELTNTRVVNYTFPAHAAQGVVEVKIANGGDLEAARAAMVEVLAAQAEIVRDGDKPKASVLVTAFGDTHVTMTGTYTISEFADADKVRDAVRRAVYARVRPATVQATLGR
jgi:small-conductance mechanosensitive channel